ncbi:MAG TPA: AI-2E family transporter [Devosiaceae bacterium]|nr:AI-2E family transporter [Devosiaceae bacterium]
MAETNSPPTPDGKWISKVVFVALLVVGGLLVWHLSYVFMIAFAAIIVATILGLAADLTARFTPLRGGWAKAVSWLLIAILLGGFIFLLGTQIAEQFRNLVTEMPDMVRQAGNLIGVADLEEIVADRLQSFVSEEGRFVDVANITTSLVSIVGMLVVVVFAGIFLAIDPDSYRRGLLQLVPDTYYGRIEFALDTAGRALRLWLAGTLVAMLVVGVVTTAALYAIGLPSALALGIIAGVLEFIPFIGPIVSVLPAILVALPEGYTMVLWVGLIYLAIQQIEGNVLVPLIQQRTADLPPLIGILSILAATLLFGLPGVLLAVPLALVIIVLVKQLYVRDILGRDTTAPGEKDEDEEAEDGEKKEGKETKDKEKGKPGAPSAD